MTTRLAYMIHASRSGPAQKSRKAIVMHGLLGNHKNMNSLCTRLATTFDDFDILALTHRAHGDSERGSPEYTLENCAADVVSLSNQVLGGMPDIVIGHSFGGKVALAVLDHSLRSGSKIPKETWVLDAMPGVWNPDQREADMKNGVSQVMSVLRDVPMPSASRGELLESLTSRELGQSISQWLVSNTKRVNSKLEWSFDLDICQQLFQNYKDTDYWPMLNGAALGSQHDVNVHVVTAGRNRIWTPEVVDAFVHCPNHNVERVEIPESGHWVHTDAPDQLFELLVPSFLVV